MTELVNLLDSQRQIKNDKNAPLKEALLKIADVLNKTFPISTICQPPKIDKQPSEGAPSSKQDQPALLQKYVSISEGVSPKLLQSPNQHTTKPPGVLPSIPKPTPTPTINNPLQPQARILRREANNQPNHNKMSAQHIYAGATKETIDTLLKGQNKTIWQQALTNELGRLAQGIDKITGTNTLQFIKKESIPKNNKITYANIVCDYRPLKTEKHRVRLTVGGDKLEYPKDASSPAANLLDAKLLINSTISDSHKGARFATIDIKDFFLQSTLPEAEYMRIHSKYFHNTIRTKYNIDTIQNEDGYIYCKIQKGMYGLKQAARLAYEQLINNLQKHGYSPSKFSPNIWSHTTRPTKFCLCIDDFGIKYFSKDDISHLIETLKTYYNITIDWSGMNYCGLTIDWNYDQNYVDISMPTYTHKALTKLNHPTPSKKQHAPHKWTAPAYGNTIQTVDVDTSAPLSTKGQRRVQAIVGTFLYYARAVDPTILPAINDIASAQANPTENTNEKLKMLLDYMHTYPQAKIRYKASQMILHIDSDAAYLVLPGAKSRVAGYYYLSNLFNPRNVSNAIPNGAIHVECKALRHVVTSAAEAETAALFHNAKTAIDIRRTLEALNHPQPPTPIKTDNSTALGFVQNLVQQKRSKSWDMRFHWLREKNKKDLQVYWAPGKNNDADYFTKHHSPTYHKQVRKRYILQGFHTIYCNLQNKFYKF